MSIAPLGPGQAALVDARRAGGGPRADRGAAGLQGHGLREPAVIRQRAQHRVGDADEVAVGPTGDPARAAGADQVISCR